MRIALHLSYLANRFLPAPWRTKLGRAYTRTKNLLRYGDWHFPHAFYIEISEFCNRSCWYCPNARGTRYGRMEETTFDAAVRRLAEIRWTGPVGFHFANEPLLDKRLPGFVRQLKSLVPGALPCIVTNGDYLTLQKAEELIALGVTRLVLSRHPPFSVVWDNRIAEIQERWPHIVQLTEVGKTIAVHTNGQFGHEGLPWQGYCIAPTLACVINVSGDVCLCCCDFYRRTAFGNVRTHTLRQIWYSPLFAELRRNLRHGEQAHPICKGCSGVI